MIDVYFELKDIKGESIGGISLRVTEPNGLHIWRTYKIYPITEKAVLFQSNKSEFVVLNGHHIHEMGEITIQNINGYMNVNIKETWRKKTKD